MSQTVDAFAPGGAPRAGGTRGTVAFVFQGGGSLSAPQVGMVRALTQAGLTPDFVIGSSAGALNAVAYASDPSAAGLQRLERLWLRLRRRSVARISVRALARGLAGRGDGLLDPAPLRELVRTGIVSPVLTGTTIAAHVVATDLMSGEPVVLSDGDTASALLASTAFPGIFPPVARGSARLIDGGVGADIPVLQAEALGADVSYVLPAAVSDDRSSALRGPLAMAYHALGQILESTARRDARAAQGTVYLLPPAASPATNPLDFRDTRRLVQDGYDLTRRWLAGRPDAVDGTSAVVRA